MVETVSSKKRVAAFLIILLIGFSVVFLGVYLTLTYTEGKEVMLLPYPSYSTENTVTGTLPPGNPDLTLNISYYSLYEPVGSLFSVSPYLVGYFEANNTLNFYISLIDPTPPEGNLVFMVSNISNASFSVGAAADYAGYGLWELRFHSDSASSVNFTIHYYREIHSFARFLVGQADRTISGLQLHTYNESYLMYIYYESAMFYVNVGGGLLFAVYSLGGMQNLLILYSAYIMIMFGGAAAFGAAVGLRRGGEKEWV